MVTWNLLNNLWLLTFTIHLVNLARLLLKKKLLAWNNRTRRITNFMGSITPNENANHDFMENCSCAIIHLVKLINAANAIVTQHKGTPVYKKTVFFSSAIIVIHTIILHILVNTWNTLSFYNIERSYLRLQDQLSCLRVPSDISGQTNSWRSLARCILTPRNKVVHVLKAKEQVQTAEFK